MNGVPQPWDSRPPARDCRHLVETVLGARPATELGVTLAHEHLIADLRDPAGPPPAVAPLALHNYYEWRRNDNHPDCLLLDSIPEAAAELSLFSLAGGRSLVEVTPGCLGRRPGALAELARLTGVTIVMGCGWYTHEYHTADVHQPAEALAERLVADCLDGAVADGNGQPAHRVKAGVIGEIGLSWPPRECEMTALRAAAMAQAVTGRALVIHPGRAPAAPLRALEAAVSAGASPDRVVLCHIDRTLSEVPDMTEITRRGAFLSFDLFGNESSHYPYSGFLMPNDGARLRLIRQVADQGFASQIVVSHDIYSKTRWVRYGGEGYSHLLRHVRPLAQRAGVGAELWHRLLVANPAAVLGCCTCPSPARELSS
jgi:phosphotriesterase-related protein